MRRFFSRTPAGRRDDGDVLRRGFLRQGAAFVGVAATGLLAPRAWSVTGAAMSADVSIEKFSAAGKSLGVVRVPRLIRTDAQWRQQLSAESFEVTRQAGTEQPWTGATWNNHADGLYRCVCCATALYDSRTKFESGTGWPSFWRPISRHNVEESRDASLGEVRTAVSCQLCAAHLGHVFEDGPPPTGLRYCMNSAAMTFVPRA